MNKTLWKNLIWNYTIRLWYRWKYRKSKWIIYYAGKRPQKADSQKTLEEKIKIELEQFNQ